MEGYDRTVASIEMHVSHNVIGRESLRIIASDKVPHNNSELMFETVVLRWAHPAMRWSEEVRVNKVVTFLYVLLVGIDRMPCTTNMVIGMVPHTMTFIENLLVKLWIFPYIIAHYEEGCLDVKFLQHLKDIRC